MDRYLSSFVKKDSIKKIVLISGPRQSGKTTLVKGLFKNFDYFNYDSPENRILMMQKKWKRSQEAVIFDELHKMDQWKQWLKGIYDTEGNSPHIIVTGSANLETFQRVGDSLAGRYFKFRMHPIDLKEGCRFFKDDPVDVFNRLMNVSGFPEPFLEGDKKFYRRWQKSHLDIILKQDFLDMYSVRFLKLVETLTHLLKTRVASSISYSNLAADLGVDGKTVKNWLSMLENMYVLFSVTPYHKNIARSLLKEPKFYFYDIAHVSNEEARLENLVACALLKEIHFIEDTLGYKGQLHYLKTNNDAEIDFLITIDDKPIICFEVKTSDDTPSKHFRVFKNSLPDMICVQLVLNLEREFDTQDGIQVRQLINYLKDFDLEKLL